MKILIVLIVIFITSCTFKPNISLETRIPEIKTNDDVSISDPMSLTTERVVRHNDKTYLTVAFPDAIDREPSLIFHDGRWIVIATLD